MITYNETLKIMKTILSIIGIILLASCVNPTYENTVEHITVNESEEILSMESDTIIVIRKDVRLYEVENAKIVAQYDLINKNSTCMPVGILIWFLFLGVVVGFVICGSILS